MTAPLIPLPLGRCHLEPGPFRLSFRSQSRRPLTPVRLVAREGDWTSKGALTLQGLYVEGFPLAPNAGAVPMQAFSRHAFPTRLATGGLIIQLGQLFELRGDFRLFDGGPSYWSRRGGAPPQPRAWPPRYWSNRAGLLWPEFEALLLVEFYEGPQAPVPRTWGPS